MLSPIMGRAHPGRGKAVYRHIIVGALACLLLTAPSAFAQDALILTVGAMNLAHNHQTVSGTDDTVNAVTTGAYGLAWEKRYYNGIAYGAEYMIYNNRIASTGHQGTVTSRLLMLTLKKYHRPWAHVYPYVGASAGLVATSVTGVSGHTGVGPALEVDGGVEFEWAHSLGIYTELRGLYAPSGAIYGTHVNVSGVGLYAGLSLLF